MFPFPPYISLVRIWKASRISLYRRLCVLALCHLKGKDLNPPQSHRWIGRHKRGDIV